MHYLILAIIVSVCLIDQLTLSHILPKPLAFTPEALSAFTMLYVVASGARQRFQYVRTAYWFVFGAVLIIMFCAIVANNEAPGPIFAGIRYYVRAMPIFFLPAVYLFKEWQIRQQLRLLLLFALIQFPVAWHQRSIVIAREHFSGDSVIGTLMDSSVLSIFLICAVCLLTALFLKRRVSKVTFFILFFYLLAATTINETKGTLILLPIALLTVVLVGSPAGKRVRMFVLTVTLFAIFLAGFIPVYDYLERKNPYYIGIENFFTSEKKVDAYLDTHAGVGAKKETGRIDAITVPLKHMAQDPVQLVMGVGIGNASHSSLGPQFIGAYFPLYEGFLVSSFSIFLIEIGILGTGLVFLLYWLIFRDALAVAQQDDSLTGWIAIGWTGVVALVVFGTPYKTIHVYGSLSYMFWYFSGLIAARRMRLALAAPVAVSEQMTPQAPAAPAPLGARFERGPGAF
jgi:hypothetical protein